MTERQKEQRARAKRVAAMVREHRAFQMKMRAITRELAARAAAKEDAWGVELKPGIGKTIAAELDLAREALALRKIEP